jgi:MEDS: MEthanogen/methylotroph, DcmR Sensory domain
MGINAVLEHLVLGDHVCSPSTNAAVIRAVAVRSARCGLRDGHKMVFFTDDQGPLRAALRDAVTGAEQALQRHQIQVLPGTASYFPDGTMHPDEMVETLSDEVDLAAHQGYAGLRVIGDLSAVSPSRRQSQALVEYESRVNKLFANGQVSAVCHYNPDGFDQEIWRHLVAAHPSTVPPTDAAVVAMLRVLRTPTGFQLIGEADLSNGAALRHLVGAALTPEEPCAIDATQLRFADAQALGCLLRVAARTPTAVTTIHCLPPVADGLRLLRADQIPGLTVTIAGQA